MTNKELADRVVALGVGVTGPYPDEKDWELYSLNLEESFTAKELVRDWRVAGALMEKMDGELLIWRQAYDNDSPVWIVETHLTNADGRDESLPRAIIEAYCEAVKDE